MNAYSKVIYVKTTFPPISLSIYDTSLNFLTKGIFTYDCKLNEKKLLQSLEATLEINPYFSGHVDGIDTDNPKLIASNRGVYFTSVSNETDIPLHFRPELVNSSSNVALSFDWSYDYCKSDYLLQVTLYTFNDGSVLDITFPHFLCDGPGIFGFLSSWASSARGEEVFAPQFDRQIVKINELMSIEEILNILKYSDGADYSRLHKPITISRFFNLNTSFIDKIANKSQSEFLGVDGPGCGQLWVAYIWKLVVSCSASRDENKGSLVCVYNARGEIGLGHNYFGNASTIFLLERTKAEVEKMSVALAAKSIQSTLYGCIKNKCFSKVASSFRLSKKNLLKDYILKYRSDLEDGGVCINNMSAYPIDKVDFGSGSPAWMDFPTMLGRTRTVSAFPSGNKDGGIVIRVELPISEMELLTQRIFTNI